MKNAIIWCTTTLICTVMLCLTLICINNSNRYVSFTGFSNPSVLDHRTGKIYTISNTNSQIVVTNVLSGERFYTKIKELNEVN